jgi:hypothetical protein
MDGMGAATRFADDALFEMVLDTFGAGRETGFDMATRPTQQQPQG